MKRPNRIRAITAFAALIGMTACAGGTPGAEAPQPSGNSVRIIVKNDVAPPSLITVWIATTNNDRQRLGTVSPNGERTFNFTAALRSVEYHLIAEVEFGAEKVSNPFNMEGATTITGGVMRPFIQRGR